MNIGLFGGTFNPIHNCHLIVAEEVHRKAGLDRVLFVVSNLPPHREEVIAAAHRLEMTRLAVAPYPAFEVSDIEVNRPGPSYTIDTVRALRRESPQDSFSFIIGLDAFMEIPSWREAETLLGLCNFIIVSRPSFRFRDITRMPLVGRVNESALQGLDRGEIDRVDHSLPGGHALLFLKVTPCPISATHTRRALVERHSLKNLLPPSVESYIIEKALYLDPA